MSTSETTTDTPQDTPFKDSTCISTLNAELKTPAPITTWRQCGTVPSRIIGTLSEYEQNRLWKNVFAVYPLGLSFKIIIDYFIEVKLLKEKKNVDSK